MKIDIAENLTKIINGLRSRSRLSILDNWQRQNQFGTWEILPTVNSQKCQPMLAFLQGEENIHLRQIWQVPEIYAGLPTVGATIHLNLIWWVDVCEVWLNGEKVRDGDLFDQKCRLLLTDKAKYNDEFVIEIKLNSPKHDLGALQLSELIFTYPDRACDHDKFADELAILQAYIPIFIKQNIDILPLQIAIREVSDLLRSPPDTLDKGGESFFVLLAKIREPLLQYSQFLKQRRIYILGNSHIDVAWLWAIAETKNAMQRTFTSALNLQERYPELIFNQSTAISYQWMEREYPELFARIQVSVAAGKWELIGGMWVEPDGNIPSGESLIRQILYGQAYFREKFNREVKIAWLPDTFGFHWQMPQILVKSGFEAFVTQKLLWNDTNKFPHQIFWWEGVDGSQILTYFSNEIGQGLEPVAIAKYLASQEDKHNIRETVWLYGVGDHGGGPTADMLDMGRDWADSPLFFTMYPNKLENFLIDLKTNLLQNSPSNLPVWQDELYLEFHRGTYTTKADQKLQNRQIEVLIGNAEKYSAIACLMANIPYPQAQLETAWQGLLLNQFHDILPGTSIPEVFIDADRMWREVREICDGILGDTLENNSGNNSENNSQSTNLQAWNFLNWQRSQLVKLPDNSLCWLENIPSLGFTNIKTSAIADTITDTITDTKEPVKISSDSEKFDLENRYIKVKINRQTGTITQIFDKRSLKSILKLPIHLQFFADKGQYWDAWNIDPNYESKKLELTTLQSIEITDNSCLLISVSIKHKFGNSTFIQEIQLTAFEAFVTVKNYVNWQEEHTLVKVAFPVNWRSPYVTYEIPMGTIQRSTLNETPEVKAKWEVPAQYWADIATDGIGLSILNDSKYGYDAQPDCLRLTLLRSPNWPSPNSDRGQQEFTYRLVPHHGDWREANIVKLAQELNNPITLKHSAKHSALNFFTQLKSLSFLQVSAPNILLSALKRSQDRLGWIMRFYEAQGKVTETKVEIFLGLLQLENIWECDLIENKKTLLAFNQNCLTINFHGYEIKTIYLSLKSQQLGDRDQS